MKLGEIFGVATKTLTENYITILKTVLAFLLSVLLLTLGGGLVAFLLGFISGVLSSIIILGITVIFIPLQFGFVKQIISIYNGQEVNAFDFIKIGMNDFKMSCKVLKVMLWTMLKYIIPTILLVVGLIIIVVGQWLRMFYASSTSPEVFTMLGETVLGVVLAVVATIWLLILSLKYMFTMNELAYDDGVNTARQIVKNSANNTKGKRGKLFLLLLLIGLLNLLLSLLMQIPVLNILIYIATIIVVTPFTQLALIAFYQDIRPQEQKIQIVEDTSGPIQNI